MVTKRFLNVKKMDLSISRWKYDIYAKGGQEIVSEKEKYQDSHPAS